MITAMTGIKTKSPEGSLYIVQAIIVNFHGFAAVFFNAQQRVIGLPSAYSRTEPVQEIVP
jgi:hypothetical protein